MASEERNAIGAFIASIITFIYFGTPIWRKTQAGAYSGDEGLVSWAHDVLWLMGGGIVIGIVVMIAFHILLSIITNNPSPEMITDERDRMIGRRGTLITLVIASAGFIAAIVMLAVGWGAIAALNTILVGMALGSTISEIQKMVYYRFGI